MFVFCETHPDLSLLGQHMKKTSISESSSDIDLEDVVETPGLLGDQTRIVPFLGTHHIINDKQKQNCCKPIGQNMQLRHNSALAVSIETDVWLLSEYKNWKLGNLHLNLSTSTLILF